jgi:hypothetical protein
MIKGHTTPPTGSFTLLFYWPNMPETRMDIAQAAT